MTTPFKELPIGTQTVMAYMNCTFNLDNILKKLATAVNNDLGTIQGQPVKIQINFKQTKNRNQISLKIYIIDKFIGVKIFHSGKFHLTGCKTHDHSYQTAVTLLNIIRSMHSTIMPTFNLEDTKPLSIILDVVMVDIDFNLGFAVDSEALFIYINELAEDVDTFYESANLLIPNVPRGPSITIRWTRADLKTKSYNKIIVGGTSDNPILTHCKVSDCAKARRKNTHRHSFTVFENGQVIQWGRYYDTEMKSAYQRFWTLVEKYRNQIKMADSN